MSQEINRLRYIRARAIDMSVNGSPDPYWNGLMMFEGDYESPESVIGHCQRELKAIRFLREYLNLIGG